MYQNLENNHDQTSSPNPSLEDEIAWLTSQIEAKKELLAEKGELPAVDLELEKRLIKEVLQTETTTKEPSTDLSGQSNMTPQSRQRIDDLITLAKTKGFRQSLKEARKESPFVLDVFHDELTAYLQMKLGDSVK